MLASESTREASGTTRRQTLQAAYHRSLRNAAKVLRIKDNVVATGTALICFIPNDAPAPISPVQVQRLADERNIDARTVRNHICVLIKLGLFADMTKDGGGRALVRSSTGEIVSLHGISIQPMIDRGDEFEEKVAEINALATEKASLRGQISAMRRKIKNYVEYNDVHGRLDSVLEGFPCRIAHLSINELDHLHNNLVDLFGAIKEILADCEQTRETSNFKEKESDRSEKPVQLYNNTTELNSIISNRITIEAAKEISQGTGKIVPNNVRSECGLDHISLELALRAAPDDWHEMMAHFGGRGWDAFANYAYQRGAELGMNASAWRLAENAIGRAGAALLVLIADVNSSERGGDILKPAGWVRAMAEKSTRGEAYIHRSIFGILNKSDTLQ